MINIPGYSITRTVYEDSYLLVAFAAIEQTSKQVLLKIVKNLFSIPFFCIEILIRKAARRMPANFLTAIPILFDPSKWIYSS